jgi:hypothetical protein
MLAGRIVVFLGFAAIIAFLVFLLVTQGSLENRLDCDRGEAVCTFRVRRLAGTSTYRANLADLGPAEVRISMGGRRARPVIAVWIRSRAGDFYFDDYLTRAAADADAEKINRFLRTPSVPRFSLDRHHGALYGMGWILAVGVAILLGWLGYVLFFRWSRIENVRV